MIEEKRVLLGNISSHARGKTLSAAFDAHPTTTLPKDGVVFVFGRQFQQEPEHASIWVAWTSAPGCLLVVVPPFETNTCKIPVEWEVKYVEPLAGGETDLGKRLAGEWRHEIRGQFIPLERIAGHVVTAGWRKHPSAGLMVITTLPLWSLTTLEYREDCRNWLAGWIAQAGTPRKAGTNVSRAEASKLRELSEMEWGMMLHLCTGQYASEEQALRALEISQVHHIERSVAIDAMKHLQAVGIVSSGVLTEQGKEILLNSRYAPYARAIWRQCDNISE